MSDIKIPGAPNICFFGWMGSGKSTAAKLLTEFGYEHAPIFGTYPGGGRDIASRLWPDHDGIMTDRAKLLAVGKLEEAAGDPDLWIRNYTRWIDQRQQGRDALAASTSGTVPELPPLVCDDARQLSQYQELLSRGWTMVRVNATEREVGEPEDLWEQRDLTVRRSRLQQSGKYQNEEQFFDPLEHYLDQCRGDYTITNDGTLEELGDEILKIVLRERRRS